MYPDSLKTERKKIQDFYHFNMEKKMSKSGAKAYIYIDMIEFILPLLKYMKGIYNRKHIYNRNFHA